MYTKRRWIRRLTGNEDGLGHVERDRRVRFPHSDFLAEVRLEMGTLSVEAGRIRVVVGNLDIGSIVDIDDDVVIVDEAGSDLAGEEFDCRSRRGHGEVGKGFS